MRILKFCDILSHEFHAILWELCERNPVIPCCAMLIVSTYVGFESSKCPKMWWQCNN